MYSLGWAVLEPNVRGSTSYGDALLRGHMKDLGGGDYADLMGGVDYLIAQGIADPAQLAIRGGTTANPGRMDARTDGALQAASRGRMVSDRVSEYALGVQLRHPPLVHRKHAVGETEAYRRVSAYTHIGRVATPTILFHGEEDTTDTSGQSMIYYRALKDRGGPARFIRFPRELHGVREPHHQR